MGRISDRLKHAWNAFANQPMAAEDFRYVGTASYGSRPDRVIPRIGNERSIISSIYTRLSIDMAQVSIRHVRLDDDGRYIEDIDSGLNNCLTIEANVDQAARAFRQDIALTLFDKGVAVLVPVDTSVAPDTTGSFDIKTMRVGEVVTWYPGHVKVSLYNEAKGHREDITLSKKSVAIIDNPLYSVMNQPSSTLQRLIAKLNLLDAVDSQAASGKLDIMIQVPYSIKSEARKELAEQRRKDIEFQLSGSQYGIAYVDGSEKITQLNRPAENNLLKTVEYLTEMLYNQLGLTEAIMNGTADEAAMLNYFNRTIEPLVAATTDAMHRSFLTKTARSQKQAIVFFKDPFRFVPVAQLAELADKFTRNMILTSNEFRQIIGYKPVKDKNADKLQNSNMPTEKSAPEQPTNDGSEPSSLKKEGDSQNGS